MTVATRRTLPVNEGWSASLRAGDAVIGLLGFLTLIGAAAGIGRLILGMQATTGLTDTYPWGIWIGFDFGMIAFAGAGFTTAAVVHVFHQHQYHAALRPAILAGLLGYMAVLLLLALDLGRPDRFYHFILYWNFHSPLFEVSWCVLLYTTVLVLEISPDVLRRLPWRWPLTVVEKIMLPVTIIGVTLSTLHQSTLGTLYLSMPYRLDARWYTELLPVLFFVSSIMAGLSLATIAYRVACRVQGFPVRSSVVIGLLNGAIGAAVLYGVLKFGEILWAGEWPLLFATSGVNLLWWAELVLGVGLPVALWLSPKLRQRSSVQWAVALLMLASVLMNRFDATLFAQVTSRSGVYSPHILEWLSTIGILAGAALAWYLAVRFLMKREA